MTGGGLETSRNGVSNGIMASLSWLSGWSLSVVVTTVLVACTQGPAAPMPATQQATPSPAVTTESPSAPDGTPAHVSRVVDGDTVDVVFQDGTTDRVRLLGIDTPELAGNDAYEYGSITNTYCLDTFGSAATEYAQMVLYDEDVLLVVDPQAGLRGSFGRLLAYVHLEGQDFGVALLELGLARVYTEGTATREAEYLEMETKARAEDIGLWGECNGGLAPPIVPPGATPGAAQPSDCDPSYPSVCIPSPPPDLNCGDIQHRRFTVLPPDPHRFDGDRDGVGCER